MEGSAERETDQQAMRAGDGAGDDAGSEDADDGAGDDGPSVAALCPVSGVTVVSHDLSP